MTYFFFQKHAVKNGFSAVVSTVLSVSDWLAIPWVTLLPRPSINRPNTQPWQRSRLTEAHKAWIPDSFLPTGNPGIVNDLLFRVLIDIMQWENSVMLFFFSSSFLFEVPPRRCCRSKHGFGYLELSYRECLFKTGVRIHSRPVLKRGWLGVFLLNWCPSVFEGVLEYESHSTQRDALI